MYLLLLYFIKLLTSFWQCCVSVNEVRSLSHLLFTAVIREYLHHDLNAIKFPGHTHSS